MFTNTNIHDELGDDFTGATAMSNAEVAAALPDTPPHYR